MNKKVIKMIVDILMLGLMLLEYSKIYTGQLLHEIFGITLLVLFIIHNVLNINFYKNLFKGKYNGQRLITTIIDLSFLLCMLFTIALGIPISEKIFSFLNINGNMTIRKLHTIFGYWGMMILALHLGLHFKMIFASLKSRIKEKKLFKVLLYVIQIIIVTYGIKAMIDTNLGLYLIGKSSFAIPTSLVLSLVNNLSIVLAISIIEYNIEKLFLKRKMDRRIDNMKTLLVYYTYTGNTKIIADMIKEKVDCDVVQLKPKIPFLEEDYQAIVDEYQSNESTKKCVEIEEINVDLKDYDKIIIGTPVWWYTITPVIREFLKNNDLTQKQVYAFATNAGWLSRTFKEIESYCNVKKELNVQFSEDYREHKCLTSNDEINEFIDSFK